MTRAYAKPISRRQWQIGLFAFALTVIVGAALVVALLLGAANPPHARNLTIIPSSNLRLIELTYNHIAANLNDQLPPVTFEVEARSTTDDAWGVIIDSDAFVTAFYIRSDGYFRADHSDWQPFVHIQPKQNKLYLHITTDEEQESNPSRYNVTFRINDEIAWQGTIRTRLRFAGIFAPNIDNLEIEAIKIYTG